MKRCMKSIFKERSEVCLSGVNNSFSDIEIK